MRIAIATFPVDRSSNYGCVLQNFALQKVLKQLGHNPFTIRLKDVFPAKESLTMLQRIFFKKQEDRNFKQATLHDFCERHISFTEAQSLPISSSSIEKWNFDAYISGSDQIWRPSYSQQYFLRYAMLDFTNNLPVRRLAYAISFGNVKWTLSRKMLFLSLIKLVSKFDIISLREEEGVEICCRFLHQEHVHTALDPTLLLDGDDYLEVSSEGCDSSGQLLTYFIDDSPSKRLASNQLFASGNFSGRQDFSIKEGNGFTQPSMEDWLAAFRTAKCIMTDSFHGTAFAILFRRPFVTIANTARGLSRFTSLLGKLQLSDRLLEKAEDFSKERMDRPIDYQKVHSCLEVARRHSIDLLQRGLSDQ